MARPFGRPTGSPAALRRSSSSFVLAEINSRSICAASPRIVAVIVAGNDWSSTIRFLAMCTVTPRSAAGNDDVRDPAQIWGSPEIDDDLKLFGNFGYLFGNGLQFYGHTNYARKKVTGGFFFRNPNTRGGVFGV